MYSERVIHAAPVSLSHNPRRLPVTFSSLVVVIVPSLSLLGFHPLRDLRGGCINVEVTRLVKPRRRTEFREVSSFFLRPVAG